MQLRMKVAVAGATGRVGHHVVAVLMERGYVVAPMARSLGVDVLTGEGLAAALKGAEAIIDVATAPSPEQTIATDFFTTAARNLHKAGDRAAVRRIVSLSIIGIDNFTAGYYAAKIAHEKETLGGRIPARVLRAAQFHEFVPVLMERGRRADVTYVPSMRTQLVAARTVAEALADLATDRAWSFYRGPADGVPAEIAGPREESMVEMARLLAAHRGDSTRIEGVINPDDPDRDLYQSGALLPGPRATLAGPTFEEWVRLGG